MRFLLVNFAVKNAMFNLNENNRFVMVSMRVICVLESMECAGKSVPLVLTLQIEMYISL